MIGNLYLAGLITDSIKKIETYYIYEQANGGKRSVNKKEVCCSCRICNKLCKLLR